MTALDLFREYAQTSSVARPAAAIARSERPSVELPSVAGIVELLARAQASGLKYPKLRLQLADGSPLRIHVAGPKSRTPGFLQLTDGGGFDNGKWYGRVSPAGVLELGRDGPSVAPMLVSLLERLAEDPAGVAAEYGHLTGNCCFCSRGLSDERSVDVGYGPVCAEKFGLPWGVS